MQLPEFGAPEAWVALGVALFLMGRAVRRRRRAARGEGEAVPRGSPLVWRDLLDDRLPHVARLSPTQRSLFHQRVERFLKEKRFVGCGGLEVTDEMRALVAGMACLMVLRLNATLFPALRKVLIYPGPFLVPVTEPDEFGLVPDEPDGAGGSEVVLHGVQDYRFSFLARRRNRDGSQPLNAKSSVFDSFPLIVTFCVCVPYFSCHASIT